MFTDVLVAGMDVPFAKVAQRGGRVVLSCSMLQGVAMWKAHGYREMFMISALIIIKDEHNISSFLVCLMVPGDITDIPI